MLIKITVKCSECGKTKELTQKEFDRAQKDKIIMCPNCFMPMFVIKVKGKVQ